MLRIVLLMLIFFTEGVIYSGPLGTASVEIPGMITVTATVSKAPPDWAVKQRHLIKTMNEAAHIYLDKYTYPGGSMRAHGKLDDDYESFKNWPLFYAIGGGDMFLEWGLREFNAITRQYSDPNMKRLYKEFTTGDDMLHLSEGYVGFQFLGLADPTIPENINRARRFAGFYMAEDPEAPNYDPVHKIIRASHTGSLGPIWKFDSGSVNYCLRLGHASLYPIVKKLEPGWFDNPRQREKITNLYNDKVIPNDIPMNLAITGIVSNAYILTGDEKYKNWVLGYVDAWMERTKKNNGIIPDNIGPNGIIGEKRNGQWWGALFGWNSRYSTGVIFNALITACECAYIISGDPKYLDLLRSQVDMLFEKAKVDKDGNLLVPHKIGPEGWFDYQPLDPFILSHLWHASMDPGDWERIERLRKGMKNNPHAGAYDELPELPKPGEERWHSDGTPFDWNKVYNNLEGQSERRNEAAHLGFLGGTNPDWPRKILDAEFEKVSRNVQRLRGDTYKHTWGSQTIMVQNPVATTGLMQMTMGAPFSCFNGGLVIGRIRYFDIDRARPGLPEDIAALVTKLESDRTVVQLVNISASETRRLIIQAGAYGEHEFTEVKYHEQTEDKDGNEVLPEKSVPVNKKFFAVELPPATSIELDIELHRFVNQPSYAFPWHSKLYQK